MRALYRLSRLSLSSRFWNWYITDTIYGKWGKRS